MPLDVFGGNLLRDEERISETLGFGRSAIAGNERLNALFAAVLGRSPPSAEQDDEVCIRARLAAHGLEE